MKTKTEKVISYLEKNGSITSMEAFKLFNVTRLASIILNLRNRGLSIFTETIKLKKGGSYAKYLLLKKIQHKR
tara:strand:+ start:976 stop:1194 length:219 start_codon:yes stop_codon:yes gene_type:complete